MRPCSKDKSRDATLDLAVRKPSFHPPLCALPALIGPTMLAVVSQAARVTA
jgi:hypothetical protein